MKLAAYKQNPGNLAPLRDLTSEELETNKKFTALFSEAENRLMLFQILSLNYRDWENEVSSLLNAKLEQRESERLHLNQRLLNYLTTAYAIMEHFERSFRHRYKKDFAKLSELDQFLAKLRDQCWAFAFFTDFRNFVQHCELPIGHYNREVKANSVAVEISYESAQLVKEYRNWQVSGLTEERGTLDLIELLHEYHVRMSQDFGKFVIRTFYPELQEVAEFYSKLTAEVQNQFPKHRMIFLKHTEIHHEIGKQTFRASFSWPPNDVFRELGMEPFAPVS